MADIPKLPIGSEVCVVEFDCSFGTVIEVRSTEGSSFLDMYIIEYPDGSRQLFFEHELALADPLSSSGLPAGE